MSEPREFGKVEELYHAALARGPSERDVFLHEACGGDEGLLREVKSLLGYEEEAQRLLEEPVAEAVTQRLVVVRGTRLGPYEVSNLIGAGGMGEVYRARDTRLGREVAIKTLSASLADDPERLRRFEREARAVASLNHPHVLTIHDVGAHEGVPYVVTELLEGETLREVLKRRAPAPRQMVAFLLQAARGVGAAHRSGIVHRDLKPENLFLTRDGRIKVLDFGLARAAGGDKTRATSGGTRPGEVLGTVAYMSPEQVRAEAVGPRSDVFSLGVVLHELVSGKHPFRRETVPATLVAILHEEPPELEVRGLPPGVGAVLARCLEKRQEERFPSAEELADALQAVLGEGAGVPSLEQIEEASPYPGLGAFTERDASWFFGREEEVRALWERLSRQRLLAVIGPSGAGKSSFVRAGVVAGRPSGWGAIVCTPGTNPTLSLAQGLTRELAGDAEAISDLLHGVSELVQGGKAERVVQAASRWRRRHDEALLVVDQLEELFTLNEAETQARFAALLARLAAEGDVHVVLSLRDDFLVRSQEEAPLRGVASDLTILLPLSPEGLRRALVEPSRKRGYRFEDDALVEEMLSEVAGERAALPLLAFAVSRLWEKRDRERRLLTREAYRAIGGVAGALAQHAEATLERIGTERTPLVRELLRNLVTAQGTRAVREREEMLSVFEASGSRAEAEEVLSVLVNARLLTSYERAGEGGESHQQVEIVHESLLQAWPRLVRWQTQDADGAQLRDQLRLAAQLWQDRGKTEDLLWSGTAYQDFALWRQRYPAPLTAIEDAFASAMTAKATRRRRRRRAAVAALVGVAATVAIVTSVSWRRAETSRRKADLTLALEWYTAGIRQREAGELLAMGRLRLDEYPTAALAHAIASLERADNAPARRFAVEALWHGPTVQLLRDAVTPNFVEWSPDGRWLALSGPDGLAVLDRGTGRRTQLTSVAEGPMSFSKDGTRLVTALSEASPLHLWSIPEGKLLETWPRAEGAEVRREGILLDRRLLTFAFDRAARRTAIVREQSIDGGPTRTLGRWRTRARDASRWALDPTGEWLVSLEDGRLLHQRLDALGEPPRVLARYEGDATVKVGEWPGSWTDRVVTADASGKVRVWNAITGRVERTLRSPASARNMALDPKDRFLASAPGGALPPGSLFLFDLQAPRAAEPLPLVQKELVQKETDSLLSMTFEPRGRWLATGQAGTVLLWNLAERRSLVLRGQKGLNLAVAFTPDGRLVSTSEEGVVRIWSLGSETNEPVRVLWSEKRAYAYVGGWVDVDARGRFAVVSNRSAQRIVVVPLDGSPARLHQTTHGRGNPHLDIPRIDPAGQRVACGYYEQGNPEGGSIRIVDLATSGERVLRAETTGGACASAIATYGAIAFPAWLPDGRLVSDGPTGLRIWDLATGSSRQVRPCRPAMEDADDIVIRTTPDSRAAVTLVMNSRAASDLSVADLATGASRAITSHGSRLLSFALDPTGTTLVTGDRDGLVRVGPLSGEGEPHLLYGHVQAVTSVAVSPDGKWIASGSGDDTIRLWPMPEGPPLHTLPYDSLLAKLRSLTNLRVVPDAASATGYKLEPGPFPGWAQAPEW